MPIFKTRNPNTDALEQRMRNAPPIPTNPFAEQSKGNRLAPEMVGIAIQQRREAQQQTPATRTLADDFVRCLGTLLAAVQDQQAGRALDPSASQALGDISRVLEVARARGVGLSSDFTVKPA